MSNILVFVQVQPIDFFELQLLEFIECIPSVHVADVVVMRRVLIETAAHFLYPGEGNSVPLHLLWIRSRLNGVSVGVVFVVGVGEIRHDRVGRLRTEGVGPVVGVFVGVGGVGAQRGRVLQVGGAARHRDAAVVELGVFQLADVRKGVLVHRVRGLTPGGISGVGLRLRECALLLFRVTQFRNQTELLVYL